MNMISSLFCAWLFSHAVNSAIVGIGEKELGQEEAYGARVRRGDYQVDDSYWCSPGCQWDGFLICGSDGVVYRGSCNYKRAKCKNPDLEEIKCQSEEFKSKCMAINEYCTPTDKRSRCSLGTDVRYEDNCAFEKGQCSNPGLFFSYCGQPRM